MSGIDDFPAFAEAEPATAPRDDSAWLTGDRAMAVVVLWGSGLFDTYSIAVLLNVREDAVSRTLHAARKADPS